MILLWAPNWYLTYHYWPTSYNTHIFEGGLLLRAAEERRASGSAQELAAVTFKEYALQDGNTLEATQTMLESRAVTEFPLERPGSAAAPPAHDGPSLRRRLPERPAPRRLPLRRLRRVLIRGDVSWPTLPPAFADLEPYADWSLADRDASASPSASRARWRSSRPSTTPPSRASTTPWPTSISSTSTRCPPTRSRLIWMYYSLMTVSFPVEVWRQPRVPDSGASSVDCVLDLKP